MKAEQVSYLKIDEIIADPDTQVRVSHSEEREIEYAEHYANGVQFPPLVVFYNSSRDQGNRYWLSDGHHRFAAAKRAGLQVINCKVNFASGDTREAAIEAACGANATHGMPRTRADKRRTVEIYWRTFCKGREVRKSSRIIAEICKVTQPFVDSVLNDLETTDNNYHSKIEGKDGRTYTVKPKSKPKPVPIKISESIDELVDQEEPEIPQVVVPPECDMEGHALTSVVKPAFEVVPKFAELMRLLETAGNLVQAIAVHPGGEFFRLTCQLHGKKGNAKHRSAELDELLCNVRMSQPHSICARCHGVGETDSVKCISCCGRGWWDRVTWTGASSELKSGLSKCI